MLSELFHPVVARWFEATFKEPTDAQRQGWPRIVAREHTLLAAPTGSGKTLAAFLASIDSLLRQAVGNELPDETQVVYVSPLKALSNDIHRNLQVPLEEIWDVARMEGTFAVPPQPIRIAVRTGDTPASERAAMLRKSPHILVTTPESLYLLLTGSKSRGILRNVRTVIVDEIHALARDKRGSHLALSLARLDRLCGTPPVRIGLSATQRPMDEIARFLVGTTVAASLRDANANGKQPLEKHASLGETRLQYDSRACHIIDTGHVRQMDLQVEVPTSELSAVCSHETWNEVYARLSELINEHRSTLVFVNTRRMAERVCHFLEEQLGEGQVASHHGSLSREIRLKAEDQLKSGQLKAIVATASLELGIDIGYIDLVCQIGSPRSIATFLQRVGRAGHALGRIPKGRLFALTRDELLEALALVRAVRRGKLDRIEPPVAPLDILAQQIVAAVACEDFDEDELFAMCRRAWPYHALTRHDFDTVVTMLSDGIAPGNRTGAYLHRDRIHHKLRARRAARITAITSGGAIPELADFRVVTEGEGTFVGTLNEDFAIESQAGNVFQLGNSSWRISYVRGGEVVVTDAHGAPATIPFWLGEAPGRTAELSSEFSELREEIWKKCSSDSPPRNGEGLGISDPPPRSGEGLGEGGASEALANRNLSNEPAEPSPSPSLQGRGVDWLQQETGVSEWAARQAVNYVALQGAAIGVIPSQQRIVFERFFDESGGMQLVVHAPFGTRINRAWGLTMRKCFCRTFDFELQASADDNGFVLSVGPQQSFPLEQMFTLIDAASAKHLLIQALLAVPMFLVRWRWNITRALAVLRMRSGKKVPPQLQRFKADDLLTAVFPQQTQCFEHRTGDLEPPDHPIVQQTVHDCLHEAMDIAGWEQVLSAIEAGAVEMVGRDTREPSPFSHQLLNANPYAFLDDAPLEERRARAVATRRSYTPDDVRDLGQLDPAAIEQVRSEAWPLVRNAEELHDTLLSAGAIEESETADWLPLFEELVAKGRATRAEVASVVRGSPDPAQSKDRRSPGDGESGDLRSGDSAGSGDPRRTNPDPRRTEGSGDPRRTVLWIAVENWPAVRVAIPLVDENPPASLPAELNREVSVDDARQLVVRGRMEISGPTTASRIATTLGMNQTNVEIALEQLELSGFLLRGQFTVAPPSRGGAEIATRTGEAGAARLAAPTCETEWCERRLLARIHRLTLAGLRRQVAPVDVAGFMRFALAHHGIPDRYLQDSQLAATQRVAGPAKRCVAAIGDANSGSANGNLHDGIPSLQRTLAMLQGFEAPAAAWEHDLLPSRIEEYDPQWLDRLFASGEVIWGRLQPPKLSAEKRGQAMTRVSALSLARRADLAWLLPLERITPLESARWDAQEAYAALKTHGALFFDDLLAVTKLLPTQLEEALRELAALGLVTSDGFAAVRTLVPKHKQSLIGHSKRLARRRRQAAYSRGGRWSKFPPFTLEVSREERAEAWARLLVQRYGVMFRDLLGRESAAPMWREVLPIYRRLEMRGELRGGRFVAGVAGEQFALPEAVEKLRQLRDEPETATWHVVSAADPLNLVGVVTSHPRVPATRGNRVLFVNGKAVASREGGEIRWLADVDPETERKAVRLLTAPGGLRRDGFAAMAPQARSSSNGEKTAAKADTATVS